MGPLPGLTLWGLHTHCNLAPYPLGRPTCPPLHEGACVPWRLGHPHCSLALPAPSLPCLPRPATQPCGVFGDLAYGMAERLHRHDPQFLRRIATSRSATHHGAGRPVSVLEQGHHRGLGCTGRDFLGQSARGFRAGAGTLHLGQLSAHLIVLQRRRGAQLWLASFDIVKCFDSLPWWALFGTLRHAGVPSAIVDCFKSFYSQLLRRFRYGQVDGDVWRATNGLAQGCPASPDLLNILFEAFHRWAAAAGFGVSVAGHHIGSASFADDLALFAGSLAEMQQLIGAYLEWCSLLGVKVTKVQVWSSLGPGRAVAVSSDTILTVPQFRIVGVMLGSDEAAATSAHFQPRLAKAIATAQRLQALQVPASITAQLWRTTVLPQALYGCEIRDVSPAALRPLLSAGLTAICSKHPLALNIWRAVELVTSGPLGDTSLQGVF